MQLPRSCSHEAKLGFLSFRFTLRVFFDPYDARLDTAVLVVGPFLRTDIKQERVFWRCAQHGQAVPETSRAGRVVSAEASLLRCGQVDGHGLCPLFHRDGAVAGLGDQPTGQVVQRPLQRRRSNAA